MRKQQCKQRSACVAEKRRGGEERGGEERGGEGRRGDNKQMNSFRATRAFVRTQKRAGNHSWELKMVILQ